MGCVLGVAKALWLERLSKGEVGKVQSGSMGVTRTVRDPYSQIEPSTTPGSDRGPTESYSLHLQCHPGVGQHIPMCQTLNSGAVRGNSGP